jgi:putative peptidoglycan lipid II flippase
MAASGPPQSIVPHGVTQARSNGAAEPGSVAATSLPGAIWSWRPRFRAVATTSNRRIFRALVTVGLAIFAVRLATVAQEILIASRFGTSDAVDAFLVAFVLPSVVSSVVGGSFSAALVPTYVHVRENQGHAAAQRLLSGVAVLILGLLLLAGGVLAALGPTILQVLGSGFDGTKFALTLGLFHFLLLYMLLRGMTSAVTAVLNARERFALASIAELAVPAAISLSLLFLGVGWGIYALCFGTVAGAFLHFSILMWTLHRQSLNFWPRWYGFTADLRGVVRQYMPAVSGSALLAGTVLVDQAVAATLAPGSVAALNYGNRLVLGVVSIGTVALSTATLPYFSKMIAANDWDGVRHSLWTYTTLVFVVTVPLTIALFAFSEPLVALLYQRGAFTETDTALVGWVQSMYVIQLPFFTVTVLFVRLISSMRANHILTWSASISVVLNIALDYLLASIMGVAGIALATSIVYIVAFLFVSLMLWRQMQRINKMGIGAPIAPVTV